MPTEKKTREKKRKPEELITMAAKDMTDKEKECLIRHLKEELNVRDNQIDVLRSNIEATRKQFQDSQKMVEDCEHFYRGQLKYVDTQLEAFVSAVKKSLVGGIN